jgi:hypothetical protein
MSGKKSFYDKLKDPKWQEKRLRIMERSGFSCEWCGGKDYTLHIHHGYYTRGFDPWEYGDDTLYCLCENCHGIAQGYKRDIHLEIARIHPKYHLKLFNDIQGFNKQVSSGLVNDEQIELNEIQPAKKLRDFANEKELTLDAIKELLTIDKIINEFIPDMRAEGVPDHEISDILCSLWFDANLSHKEIFRRMLEVGIKTGLFSIN